MPTAAADTPTPARGDEPTRASGSGRTGARPPRPRHLHPADYVAAARLHKRGASYASIAKALDCSPDDLRAIKSSAYDLLEAYTAKAAADWIQASHVAAKKGDHRPAMALLEHTQVVQVQEPEAIRAGGVTVNIGFAMPGMPAPASQSSRPPGGVQVIAGAQAMPASRALEPAREPDVLTVSATTLSPVLREGQSERAEEEDEKW